MNINYIFSFVKWQGLSLKGPRTAHFTWLKLVELGDFCYTYKELSCWITCNHHDPIISIKLRMVAW